MPAPTHPYNDNLHLATNPDEALKIWIDRAPIFKPRRNRSPIFLHNPSFTLDHLRVAEQYAFAQCTAAREAMATLHDFKQDHYAERIPDRLIYDVAEVGMSIREPNEDFGRPGWSAAEREEAYMRSLVRRIGHWRALREVHRVIEGKLRRLIDVERATDEARDVFSSG